MLNARARGVMAITVAVLCAAIAWEGWGGRRPAHPTRGAVPPGPPPLPAADLPSAGLRAEPAPEPSVTGSLRVAVVAGFNGAPIAGVSASLCPPASGDPVRMDGEFGFDRLATGTYRVEARAEGFVPGMSDPVEVKPGEEASITVALRRWGGLQGCVRGGRPVVPVAEASVAIVRTDGGTGAVLAGPGDSVESDEQGRFALERLPPGIHTFRAVADGYLSEEREIEIFDGLVRDAVFDLGKGGTIRGRVTGSRHRGGDQALFVLRDAEGRKLAEDRGGFEWSSLRAGSYRVEYWGIGARSALKHQDVVVVEGTTTKVTFEVPGARLHGVVRRRGLPQAELEVILWLGDLRGRSSDRGPIRTNALGEYAFDDVAPGAYIFTARWIEFEVVVPDGMPDVRRDFDLPQGILRGLVEDSLTGTPVENADVWIRPHARPNRPVDALNLGPEDSTDRTGRFETGGIAAGEWDIRVTHGTHAPEVVGPIVLSQDGDVTVGPISLRPGGAIRGTVRNRQGAPLSPAALELRRPGGESLPLPAAHAQAGTDNLGSYRFEGLEPGEYEVIAVVEGYSAGRTRVMVVAGQTAVADPEAGDWASLRLRVTTPSGTRVSGLVVQVRDSEGRLWDQTMHTGSDPLDGGGYYPGSEMDGTCPTWGGLAPGRYSGEVEWDGRRVAFDAVLEPGRTTDVQIVLP